MGSQAYKHVNSDGIQAVIIHRKKILLLKRVNIPFFISNPGIWSFVSGRRESGETHLQTAYREIKEETKLAKKDLMLLRKDINVQIAYPLKRKKWENKMFIFQSSSAAIRLNYEHTQYKWVSYKELTKHKDTMRTIYNSGEVLPIVRSSVLRH